MEQLMYGTSCTALIVYTSSMARITQNEVNQKLDIQVTKPVLNIPLLKDTMEMEVDF